MQLTGSNRLATSLRSLPCDRSSSSLSNSDSDSAGDYEVRPGAEGARGLHLRWMSSGERIDRSFADVCWATHDHAVRDRVPPKFFASMVVGLIVIAAIGAGLVAAEDTQARLFLLILVPTTRSSTIPRTNGGRSGRSRKGLRGLAMRRDLDQALRS